MSDEYGERSKQEKTRICPSCRTEISILATKCKFCGESVDRPKDESRELSIRDLGGETIYHRAPSGSVMDALEMFRAEEGGGFGVGEVEKKDLASIGAGFRGTGMPELDARSRELAEIVSSTSPHLTGFIKKPPPPTAKERAIRYGGIALIAIVSLFAAAKVTGWVRAYIAERNKPPEIVVHNRAPALLDAGNLVGALEAAAEAVSQLNNDENQRIAREVIAAIDARVQELLNAHDWSREKIAEATKLASDAARIIPNPTSLRLKSETQTETNLYGMVLAGIDRDATAVRFKMTQPDGTRAEIGPFQAEDAAGNRTVIEGRFEIQSIMSTKVVVKDLLRKNRAGSPRTVTFETSDPLPH